LLHPPYNAWMPDYRRNRVPGATYFFTVSLHDRRSDLLVRHIDALRDAVREVRRLSDDIIELVRRFAGIVD